MDQKPPECSRYFSFPLGTSHTSCRKSWPVVRVQVDTFMQCSCNTLWHGIVAWLSQPEQRVTFRVTLSPSRSVKRRLVTAIKFPCNSIYSRYTSWYWYTKCTDYTGNLVMHDQPPLRSVGADSKQN